MDFIEPSIQQLFPTPLLYNKLNRDLEKKELEYVECCYKNVVSNSGNFSSEEVNVLHHDSMKDIKFFIEQNINYYVKNIHAPRFEVSAYITQSWFNYTNTGQYHHKHAHPNSWISGCIYVSTDREKDRITFYNDKYHRISLPTDNYNPFNSESWWFSVGTGDIVIFPSYLTHMVEQTTSNDTRVSIAINTFLKGYIGDEHSLTGLHLKEQDSDAPQRKEARPENQQGGY